jgi:hypothetical protein
MPFRLSDTCLPSIQVLLIEKHAHSVVSQPLPLSLLPDYPLHPSHLTGSMTDHGHEETLSLSIPLLWIHVFTLSCDLVFFFVPQGTSPQNCVATPHFFPPLLVCSCRASQLPTVCLLARLFDLLFVSIVSLVLVVFMWLCHAGVNKSTKDTPLTIGSLQN